MAKLSKSDLDFILSQILISEAHAAGTPLSSLIPQALLPWGLRTVDGSFNNIVPGQSTFGQADLVFPRLLPPNFRTADTVLFDPDGPGGQTVGDPTSYAQTSGAVFDAQPRIISNLIVDQTANNPAAYAATFDPGLDGILGNADDTLKPGAEVVNGIRFDGTPFTTHFIPNVSPDEGLSAPYNSWFTLFGQFFDHGLDLVTKGGSGTVFVPLQSDDPLFNPASPQTNFMVLTRATNQPGPDGLLGTADDIHQHTNTTTPFVDQNQTYTSHPSHQVFLREYVMDATGHPVATGRMLDGANGGLANWAEVKAQARDLLGIDLSDADVTDLPLLATDPYGMFLRGPNGFAQVVFPGADGLAGTADDVLVEGNPLAPISTTGAVRTGHAFLDDIAHSAAPRNTNGTMKTADADGVAGADDGNPATYDNELLDAHFITGDGRGNENIGLTTVHHVFHAEHNRQVDEIKATILASLDANGQPDTAYIAEWLVPGANQADGVQALEWNGERLFQAARFATEMQYQHLVFEEFARKVSPDVDPFAGYQTNIDPAIMAEFAHVVYRFGHSMLTETVARTNADGSLNDIGLIQAFLNPLEFTDGGTAGILTPTAAAASVVRGMTRQVGNELDEFVTEALRNNLVGLPLDLATINMARARDTGVPSLNTARAMFFADTGGNAALRPYDNWVDFGLGLKNPESLINFVAAYGQHSSITGAATVTDKRLAAMELVLGIDQNGDGLVPTDSVDFMNSTGTWAGIESGLNLVDFWVGGLAERQASFGGLLGSTFNFVFETQMEALQNGDRLYYLSRNAGLSFLPTLEANSFSELLMLNLPGVGFLPADSFSRPDFIVDLANLGTTGPILDDPATPYDETTILTRMADGTVRALTDGQHIVMGGTAGNDRIQAGNENDTVWGMAGNDRIEGGTGDDMLMGGDGDDIITDLFGIDVLKGGNGNDAINAGPGLGDIILPGAGNDFVIAGPDGKEVFGGEGNDFITGGSGADIVFGNEGNDWIEGGDQADLLQGDMGNPFQDSRVVGNDVIIGGGGDDDYDAESGDDIMLADAGVERSEGMLGFDWVTYVRDPQAADADMLFNGLIVLPAPVDALRDRFDMVEGLSGGALNDVLRGDNRDAALLTVVDPNSGFDQVLRNISLISGLQDVLGAGVTSFSSGNIILGGAGSDTIEGRGGNDIIDGDKWLNVRLAGVDNAGVAFSANSMSEIQARVFAGQINPGNIQIVREILTAPAGNGDIDRAVYADVRANFNIITLADGSLQIQHVPVVGGGGGGGGGGALDTGTDTLRNIERLVFSDQVVLVPGNANNAPTGANATLTIAEGGSRTLNALDFGFSDPDGGDTLSAVRIDTLPTGASLTLGGVAVAAGQIILTADIALGLVFTPPVNANGAFGFTFSVRDEVGAFDAAPNALTINVTPVNDAPTGANGAVTVAQNGARALVAADFGFSDVDLGDSLSGVRIDTLPTAGSLTLSGAPATAGLVVTAAALAAGNLAFTPAPGAAGAAYATFTFSVRDQGNAFDPVPNTLTINLTGNNPPTGAPSINDATPTEGQALTASTAGIADANGLGAFSFQWQSSTDGVTWNDVVGATAQSFTPGLAQRGLLLRVEASYADGGGTLEAVNSAATGGVGSLIVGNNLDNTLNGTALNDELRGLAGNDTLNGLGGSDRLDGGTGNDTYSVDAGDVLIEAAGAGVDLIQTALASYTLGTNLENLTYTGAGNFSGNGNNVANVLTGGGGTDVLNGQAGSDTLNGNGGNDTLAGAVGNDTLNGGTGNDLLNGGAGNDVLLGAAGNDRLIGGAGNDVLNGGTGLDIFVFGTGSGNDTVQLGFDADATGGQDRLDIVGYGITAANFAARVAITDLGANTSVTIDGTAIITLLGVDGVGANTLTQADFLLA